MIKHPTATVIFLMALILSILGSNSPRYINPLFIQIPIRSPILIPSLCVLSIGITWIIYDALNPHHRFYDDLITLIGKFKLRIIGNDTVTAAFNRQLMKSFNITHLNKNRIKATIKRGYTNNKKFDEEYIKSNGITNFLDHSYHNKYKFYMSSHVYKGSYIEFIGNKINH